MNNSHRPRFSVVCAAPPGADVEAVEHLAELRSSVRAQDLPGVEVVSRLADATGEWVLLPDVHDTLQPTFCSQVLAYVDAHPDADLVCVRPWLRDEGGRRDSLPGGWMYRGDPCVELSADERRFPLHPTASALPLDALRASGVVIDDRTRPGFEHAHLVASYLLTLERPAVGFVADAGYDQRRLTPTRDRRLRADLRRYGDVLEYGPLALLRRGPAPRWLQGLVVAELGRYVGLTDSQAPTGVPTSGPPADRFHTLMAQILGCLDEDAVSGTDVWIREPGRSVLQHGWTEAGWHGAPTFGPTTDGLTRVSWFFTGTARPVEGFEPVHAKIRDLDYCGRTLLQERIVWLPTGTPIELDGVVVTPTPHPAPADRTPTPVSREGRRARRWARRRRVRARYAEAWVFLDRISSAGDSAEVLFRHVREHHPEVNAWFTLEPGGPEWERFVAAGEGDRLVAYGSLQWRLLMSCAQHLISSHVDEPIVRPPLVEEFTTPRWRYHFLNHGLIKDDLSAWLKDKPIATFVTSSPQEYASIAGDHTPYPFSTHEVVDTGMPRFDRLLEVGARRPPDQRDLVLVAPTWRSALSSQPTEGTSRRELKAGVLETEYARQWLAFLRDPVLADACRAHGLTLAFLPHPYMQPMLPLLDLPAHVRPLEYDGFDVQEFFARSRVMVTDFSSVAFNAAYLERPLVYFQFDEDVVLGGGHVGRRGYFDYRRDGFGPVETTVDDAVGAVVAALEHGPAPAPTYLTRIAATFPVRDGGCCERVVTAIRRTERVDTTPVATPTMPAPVGAV